ncbi:hypothetical protein BJP40_12040 [Streptomyces sp. CC53]|uniref:hypothetical protein n=1 Tax=Streptomyces sp. CC53 TaxID=1906740 RepID=UPI0008DCC062|nr:hypothetical protein [Streptomyces sp. CC53]OII59994.1 hypothetical protein BJP40_12040 [Streptomyces sp. CC53]
MDETTNTGRAARGAAAVAGFLAAAAKAGATLTPGDRAELGRAAVEAYGPVIGDPDDALCLALSDILADLYHHADDTQAPHALLGAALMELSTTVNMLPVLEALGDDGRPGILTATIAAVLAYGDEHGVCIHAVTSLAYEYWAEEVEEERFMRLRAQHATE